MPEDKGLTRSEREERVLQFWKNNKIFEKSLKKYSPRGEFVFYDGPPFATGLPHYGSLLSSIIKDVVPRYKTMRGFHVSRRWGWDCHGLPIENMVEKELGLKHKKEIEEIGITKFNQACRDSVLKFVGEWKQFVDRIGRFVDFENSYKTMDTSYIESVWWALKEMNGKGLLYEGRKVLLYCPHCETPLAKAEIAMDDTYKDITEESVYVKFKIVGAKDGYFLAWTTTPWTLPGNVALAVGADIDYVEVKVGTEILVLAKKRLSVITEPYEIVAEHKGKEMVGMEYEPLYELSAVKESGKKGFYIAEANFVNTEEGTGIVHTAVLYGEDDYNLGLQLDLPMVPLLTPSVLFNKNAPIFIQGQYFKKAEKAIKEDLESRNLLLKREQNTHSYPHCHRCGTALIYNALSSWFINIQKIKPKLISLNEEINWVPEYLKHGRFLNIVDNAPDWTISRNRYWAAPLPIWKDANGKVYVIGSINELKQKTKKSGNKYFIMRHGGTEANAKEIVSFSKQANDHLTEEGRTQTIASAKNLKGKKIDLIVSSPFVRTKETAEIVAQTIGLPESSIVFDERLQEVNPGEFDGKDWGDYHRYMYETGPDWFARKIPQGEALQDVGKRVGSMLYELEATYKDQNILIVTHGGPAWLAYVTAGLFEPDHKSYKPADSHVFVNDFKRFDNAEVRELPFVPLPHNENFEIDLHRPHIDATSLVSETGEPLTRIPEVLDGWFESGSMPFAEYHFPIENKEKFEKHFPGDFIAEYIAQTRTWFYYMHVVGAALFDKLTFRNVVTTGTILAQDGSKMSKSKGNYTDPMLNIKQFGADALRYYLMSSVVMQAEDVRFVDDEVKQAHNQVVNILWNTFKFYEMYVSEVSARDPYESTHVLDIWILRRLNDLIQEITGAMERYDMVRATRPIKDFVADFSTWYIRRSRDRFKSDDAKDKQYALATTKHVLLQLSKLLAPVMPFIAEDVYQKVKNGDDAESVHLAEWPLAKKITETAILENMERVRDIVSSALEARSKANIKIRQPLQKLEVKDLELSKEYQELIKDELNVKEVVENKKLEADVLLDIVITSELAEEGQVREIIRSIQEMRKEKNLSPKDVIKYEVFENAELLKKYKEQIEKTTNIEIVF